MLISDINTTSSGSLIDLCKEALLSEAKAIEVFANTIDDRFEEAVHLLAYARGPIIVTGIGKSGHIARKIASTLRSIGKHAAFLHPAEASHGDLGLIHPESVVLAFSNSGETSELSDLLYYCETHAVKIISVTANQNSTLSKHSAVALAYGKVKEVCPNGLAPTTSTTLSLAIGDGLAIGVATVLGTTPDDFRRYHPGGKLGSKLLRISDIMHSGNALPIVKPDAEMSEVVITMSEKGFGVAIVEDQGHILGIITDGDMRRRAAQMWSCTAKDMLLGKPLSIDDQSYAFEAMKIMNDNTVTCLVVEGKDGELIGLIHIHDCVRAGVQR